MRRKIFLVRHGESADKQHSQTDFDRLLTDRGKKSVSLLGQYFKSEKISFDAYLSSPASRAKSTIQLIASELSISESKFQYYQDFYSGTEREYIDVIQQNIGVLLLVGHNPSISDVIGKIIGDYSISLLPGQCARLEWDDMSINTNPSVQLIGPFY